MAEDPGDYWDLLFEADSVSTRLAVLRLLLRHAADNDPEAITLLYSMLPSIDRLIADVQAALGPRN